jgi:5-methylcytosine-specific restriction endonuclease McrA
MLNRKTPLHRTATLKTKKRLQPRKKDQDTIDREREEREADWRFYMEIWNEREHKCQECGKWLGDECRTIYMDHLIEKSTHNELRYEKPNIWVVCWEHHSQKTNGYPAPKHKQAIEQAKIRYNIP